MDTHRDPLVPDFDAVREAARRIAPHVHRTPVMTCSALDAMAGAELYFKCENFQKAGAFKFRGACNAVFSLPPADAESGVLTHSSGNHAAALALSARRRGIPAWIVMPRTAPAVKRAAVEGYGGRIVLCEPTLASREDTAERVRSETGASFIHPYNDPRVIAGQGTAALELMADAPPLDMLLVPIGGGGLASGTCLAAGGSTPAARVVAAEPAGADDAFRSLREGRILPSVDPRTIADGLLTSLGTRTFPILRRRLAAIVTVSDAAIVRAMRTLFERMKIVVEPSAAVPVAALMERSCNAEGRRVGVILSGGNVQLDRLPWESSPGA